MKWIDDAIDSFFTEFGKRASGRTVAILAVILYGGLGLAVPLVLDWPVPWLVSANVIGAGIRGSLDPGLDRSGGSGNLPEGT